MPPYVKPYVNATRMLVVSCEIALSLIDAFQTTVKTPARLAKSVLSSGPLPSVEPGCALAMRLNSIVCDIARIVLALLVCAGFGYIVLLWVPNVSPPSAPKPLSCNTCRH
jgi:hypothetical protein